MSKPGPWVLAAIAVASLVAVGWVFFTPLPTGDPVQSRSDGIRNGIEFAATYNGTRAGVSEFYLRFETHTVDLTTYDPRASVVLEHGSDRLMPLGRSREDSRSSHHIAATLFFDAGAVHDRLVLVAQDLGGVPERRLEFAA